MTEWESYQQMLIVETKHLKTLRALQVGKMAPSGFLRKQIRESEKRCITLKKWIELIKDEKML